jgi:hypothetical protein
LRWREVRFVSLAAALGFASPFPEIAISISRRPEAFVVFLACLVLAADAGLSPDVKLLRSASIKLMTLPVSCGLTAVRTGSPLRFWFSLDGVNGMVELFSSAGTDPATPPIYTFDLGMNFRMDQHTILDVGVNLGLNKAAPKAQVYSGISLRF